MSPARSSSFASTSCNAGCGWLMSLLAFYSFSPSDDSDWRAIYGPNPPYQVGQCLISTENRSLDYVDRGSCSSQDSRVRTVATSKPVVWWVWPQVPADRVSFAFEMGVQKKGRWTKYEDNELLRLIGIYGAKSWTQIPYYLETRSHKQCRERYHQYLKSTINLDPITQRRAN
ncbi:hypothetical protein BDV97DRAFT_367615 [Delphinella strobiligena]|nr:hypothetical protein BDV97DRAFT_367615 [Delphinella strobiligena]